MGGEKVLERVFEYLSQREIAEIRTCEYIDEIQYEIIKCVRETIADLAKWNEVEKSECASTLVIFAYDKSTGEYISIHLGDGGIIGEKNNEEICMISSPENGMMANYTWLTTSENAFQHLRIGFGNVKNYKRILLVTDGATVVAKGKYISTTAENMIKDKTGEELLAYIEESAPIDDASCIVIDFLSQG